MTVFKPVLAGAEDAVPAPKAAPLGRIVHVCRQYRPARGGLEDVVEQLARAQHAAGHDVAVVTLDRLFEDRSIRFPARETLDGIDVIRIPFTGSRRYPIAPAVLRHIRDAAIVHVHGIDFFFDFLAATRFIHRRTLVATTHGGFFHTDFAARLKRAWFATITRASASRYAAIVACSVSDAAAFATLHPPRIETIENGIDTARFAMRPVNPARSMLCFGRLSPNKGLPELLDWFARVHALDAGWTLTIAGRPDGVSVETLRRHTARLGLGRAVRIVASPSDAALATLIGEAGVYCSASHYEGFGLAAVEAGLSGLLPVLRPISAFRRTIERLGSGVLSDFAATDRSARAFLDSWKSWRGGKGTAPPVRHDFGWAAASDAYLALYRSILPPAAPHPDAHPAPRRIGAIDVVVHRKAETVALIERHVADRTPLMLAFCNAHTVNMARADPGFADALSDATVVNDGIGVDIASRVLFGHAFPENLNGTDLTPDMLATVTRPLRIFLVGSAPGVARRAAIALARRFPRHSFVGTSSGFVTPSDEPMLRRRIAAARPDVVLAGMGNPRQEVWAAGNHARLGAVVICVGAYFDFVAGEVRRAPRWIRKLRGEWLFRLALEPRRLAKRYLYGNASFLFHVAVQRLARPRALAG